MYKINCKELTGETCDFSVEGESKKEVADKFYAHGAESPLHKEKYYSATEEDKTGFAKKLDEYLKAQE